MSSPQLSPFSSPGIWPDGLDQQIAVAPDRQLNVRVYGRHPDSQIEPAPLVLHFHAGAFVAGSLDQGACIAGLLADAGAV